MIAYQSPMLQHVDYKKIQEDEDFGFSLTDLEYGTLESCRNFLTALKVALLEENLIQIPEWLTAHLCAYLGTVITLHTVHQAEVLESSVIPMIKRQANAAYKHFNQYPINSTVKNHEQKKVNLEKLRDKTPGSIVVQTMRLGRVMTDILEELKNNQPITSFRKHKQTEAFCSNEMLTKIMLLVGSEKCAEWRKQLNGLSDNYVINQLAIQIGWLIGYFSHLDNKIPEQTDYFNYGLPIITLYREHVYKLMSAYAGAVQTQEEKEHPLHPEHSEVESLLGYIRRLSEKAHAQRLPVVSDFQKQIALTQAGTEKIVIGLINEKCEVKIILMSLFYFWFTLEASLCGADSESIDNTDVFSHMVSIIALVKKSILALPQPKLSPEINALNKKMQLLKDYIPHPEILDQVAPDKVEQQTAYVNQSIHVLIHDYMKQDIHIEAITNVLFGHWLRLSVFFGVSERDWQKMDYYLPEVLKIARGYLSTIFDKKLT